MKTFILGTGNMNGGGANPIRQMQVKSLFQRKNVDVILMLETHITVKVEHDWYEVFKGQCLFSNMPSVSAGVGILLRPGLTPD